MSTKGTGLSLEQHKKLGLLLYETTEEMKSLFCVQNEAVSNPCGTVAYNKTSKIGKQAAKVLNDISELRVLLDNAVIIEHPDKVEPKHGLWTNIYKPNAGKT